MGPGVQTTLLDSANRQVKLLRPLGKGGFGAVYLADVTSAEGLVQRMAVKVLLENLAADPAMEARARDEARVMSLLNHDHVVKIHALTEIGGRSAVLMEYIEGIDGGALIEASRLAGDGGLPLTVAGAIVEGAASALHAAWSSPSPLNGQPLNIVHRDIKPANLLISVSGVVKVLDFGVARGDFERESHTRAAQVAAQMGTRRYMSPERWLVQQCSAPADVFALGVSMCELLTGEELESLPLEEKLYAERVEGLIAALAVGEHPPETQRRLGHLIRRMLAWDPDDRPTAAQVEVLVTELLEGVDGPSLRRYARDVVPTLLEQHHRKLNGDNELHEMTNSLVTPGPRRAERAEATQPRLPLAAIALGAALVVALGVGGFLWAERGAEVPVQPELPEPELPEPDPPEPDPNNPGTNGGATPNPPTPQPVDPGTTGGTTPAPPTPQPVDPGTIIGAAPPKPAPPKPEPKPAPTPVVPTSPSPEPVVEAVEPEEIAPPRTISIKVTGDPVPEQILVDGKRHEHGDIVMLMPGRHDLVFSVRVGDARHAKEYPCTVTVAEGHTRIKFVQEKKSCSSF